MTDYRLRNQNTPAFLVAHSAAQSINTGTETQLQWDTETLDTDGDFASNVFTPQVEGEYYIFAGTWLGDLNDQKHCEVRIRKNGSAVFRARQSASGATAQPSNPFGGTIISCNGSTDYIDVSVYHDHGSARNAQNGTTLCVFGGFRIR